MPSSTSYRTGPLVLLMALVWGRSGGPASPLGDGGEAEGASGFIDFGGRPDAADRGPAGGGAEVIVDLAAAGSALDGVLGYVP